MFCVEVKVRIRVSFVLGLGMEVKKNITNYREATTRNTSVSAVLQSTKVPT